MDFLHCNYCGHVPGHLETRRYSLTSCGHVFCETCSRRAQEVCGVCQASCRLVEISSESKNEIKAYFMDPIDIIKDSMRHLTQVIQFQRTQQKSYNVQFGKLIDAQKFWNAEREALKSEVSMLKKTLDITKQREQNWIGHGILRGPQTGGCGSGFFDQSSDKSLNSLFAPNPTPPPPPVRRQNTPGQPPLQQIFPNHSASPVSQHCCPGRLTLPHTPQRRDHQRLYASPGFDSTSTTTYSSTATTRFSSNPETPELVSRLKQLRWGNTPTRNAEKKFSNNR